MIFKKILFYSLFIWLAIVASQSNAMKEIHPLSPSTARKINKQKMFQSLYKKKQKIYRDAQETIRKNEWTKELGTDLERKISEIDIQIKKLQEGS